ncbi:MAG: DUF1173 family protein, partial [Burkholderiaceae bacterium]
LQKYLQEAAKDLTVKGVALADRLYVPEPFSEATRFEAAQRRRSKLAVLNVDDPQAPLAIVIGEFKVADSAALGSRVWIKHMPDSPLLVAGKTWERMQRVFAPLFEARDADTGHKVRLVMTALIRARREHTYEIDAASMMLTSAQWIPIDGVHELPLIEILVAAHRRFIKPLRYDARRDVAFPNALLLDSGPQAVPLHVVSPFTDPKERQAREAAISGAGSAIWLWRTSDPMSPLPAASARRSG